MEITWLDWQGKHLSRLHWWVNGQRKRTIKVNETEKYGELKNFNGNWEC